MLKITMLVMLVIGIILLFVSLQPIRVIYREQSVAGQKFAWKCLGILVVFFILGYAVFITTLLKSDISTIDTIVTIILFCGGCFVVAVTRLSLLSIKEIKKMGLLERHHALHDALTNLPNRTLLNETMALAIASAKRKKLH